MKGLILCAGKGTRLYPFTLAYPKTLIPVANRSLLQLCIEKLKKQGITEIGIVIHPTQEAAIKEQAGTGERWGVNITYIYQTEPKGISHAIRQAEHYIGNDSFILLLGDNLILDELNELKELVETNGCHAALMVSVVKNPQDYGIVEVINNRIVRLEEKPSVPKSNLAIIGAFAFTNTIFSASAAIQPSARGEYEITDAIQWMLDQGCLVSYYLSTEPNMDVGTLERWLEANRMMLDLGKESKEIDGTVILDNCKIIAPVRIGQNCVLKDCVIGPYVSIGDGSNIEGCRVENSIILNGVHLKQVVNPIKNNVIGFRSMMAGLQSPRKVGDE
ncbi:sugar phosphate nucleotidyltransferase [Gorillibacterium massiliense]|uniref:sugar phosphate nucleotidyltransferase n=1 Tax=Gorillibacterium massiliense TaxID=1280390 RepID=UPI0004B890F0|nr:sugar phosphate nucleotidyltransferase [Gorillibacterium massiliense]